MPMKTRDLRIESIRPLISPAILIEELPLSEAGSILVSQTRDQIVRIMEGEDDRLVVVVGPCSIHDVEAGMEYGRRLKALADELEDDLCVVMRVYFEKPRTTVGWKGLINDPHLDGTCRSNEGLKLARRLLLDLLDIGVTAGCELLDPVSPQFISDLIVWGAIGARTTESQVHRQLASGLSVPVGFKNGTDGGVKVAIDALAAAAGAHSFFGVTEQGLAGIVTTTGNDETHIILRGGERGTNYDTENVQAALSALDRAGKPRRLMVDTSHGNSGKDHNRQPIVASDVAQQIAAGERGIIGVLMESFLVEGRQDLVDRDKLVYGQSITDACVSWDQTVPSLRELAAAVRSRREARVPVGSGR
ncbi:MAG: 3-deoxy-7-phosphoheptulonate synthase [Chloroflexota bacterium]